MALSVFDRSALIVLAYLLVVAIESSFALRLGLPQGQLREHRPSQLLHKTSQDNETFVKMIGSPLFLAGILQFDVTTPNRSMFKSSKPKSSNPYSFKIVKSRKKRHYLYENHEPHQLANELGMREAYNRRRLRQSNRRRNVAGRHQSHLNRADVYGSYGNQRLSPKTRNSWRFPSLTERDLQENRHQRLLPKTRNSWRFPSLTERDLQEKNSEIQPPANERLTDDRQSDERLYAERRYAEYLHHVHDPNEIPDEDDSDGQRYPFGLYQQKHDNDQKRRRHVPDAQPNSDLEFQEIASNNNVPHSKIYDTSIIRPPHQSNKIRRYKKKFNNLLSQQNRNEKRVNRDDEGSGHDDQYTKSPTNNYDHRQHNDVDNNLYDTEATNNIDELPLSRETNTFHDNNEISSDRSPDVIKASRSNQEDSDNVNERTPARTYSNTESQQQDLGSTDDNNINQSYQPLQQNNQQQIAYPFESHEEKQNANAQMNVEDRNEQQNNEIQSRASSLNLKFDDELDNTQTRCTQDKSHPPYSNDQVFAEPPQQAQSKNSISTRSGQTNVDILQQYHMPSEEYRRLYHQPKSASDIKVFRPRISPRTKITNRVFRPRISPRTITPNTVATPGGYLGHHPSMGRISPRTMTPNTVATPGGYLGHHPSMGRISPKTITPNTVATPGGYLGHHPSMGRYLPSKVDAAPDHILILKSNGYSENRPQLAEYKKLSFGGQSSTQSHSQNYPNVPSDLPESILVPYVRMRTFPSSGPTPMIKGFIRNIPHPRYAMVGKPLPMFDRGAISQPHHVPYNDNSRMKPMPMFDRGAIPQPHHVHYNDNSRIKPMPMFEGGALPPPHHIPFNDNSRRNTFHNQGPFNEPFHQHQHMHGPIPPFHDFHYPKFRYQ